MCYKSILAFLLAQRRAAGVQWWTTKSLTNLFGREVVPLTIRATLNECGANHSLTKLTKVKLVSPFSVALDLRTNHVSERRFRVMLPAVTEASVAFLGSTRAVKVVSLHLIIFTLDDLEELVLDSTFVGQQDKVTNLWVKRR